MQRLFYVKRDNRGPLYADCVTRPDDFRGMVRTISIYPGVPAEQATPNDLVAVDSYALSFHHGAAKEWRERHQPKDNP